MKVNGLVTVFSQFFCFNDCTINENMFSVANLTSLLLLTSNQGLQSNCHYSLSLCSNLNGNLVDIDNLIQRHLLLTCDKVLRICGQNGNHRFKREAPAEQSQSQIMESFLMDYLDHFRIHAATVFILKADCKGTYNAKVVSS